MTDLPPDKSSSRIPIPTPRWPAWYVFAYICELSVMTIAYGVAIFAAYKIFQNW